VDTYDATSGRRVWTKAAPRDCFIQDPVEQLQQTGPFLSLDVDCPNGLHSYDGSVTFNYAYSTVLDASTGLPLPGFTHFPDGSLTPIGDHELLQEQVINDHGLGYRVIDSRTGRTLWRLNTPFRIPPAVTGGQGFLVVTDHDVPQISVYRATDGKQLWHHTFHGTDGESASLEFGTVVDGQVRVIQESPHPVNVITFDKGGRVAGTQELPMFDEGGIPRVVGGDYRTLVVKDTSAGAAGLKNRYVLLTATH
jgi:hypothetical protein